MWYINHSRNDILCVECDVKPYTCTLTLPLLLVIRPSGNVLFACCAFTDSVRGLLALLLSINE